MADVKFSPAELEFCAENELIYVCPTVSTPRVFSFLSGNFGPLVAGVNVQVPLWLAVTLKECNKARIVLPDWMRLDALKAAMAEEEFNFSEDEAHVEELASVLPFHFVEVAEVILRVAEDDCAAEGESAEALSDQLQQLITLRERKLHKGIKGVLQQTKDPDTMENLLVLMDGVSAMEVAGMRDGFMRVRAAGPRPLLSLSLRTAVLLTHTHTRTPRTSHTHTRARARTPPPLPDRLLTLSWACTRRSSPPSSARRRGGGARSCPRSSPRRGVAARAARAAAGAAAAGARAAARAAAAAAAARARAARRASTSLPS